MKVNNLAPIDVSFSLLPMALNAVGGATGQTINFSILNRMGVPWGQGLNSSGQLGNLSTTGVPLTNWTMAQGSAAPFPLKVLALGSAVSVGLRLSDGTAWSWGANVTGYLGINVAGNKNTPTSVVGGNSFILVNAGNAGVTAIRGLDGTAWSWGSGASGQLGDNSTTAKSSPVSVVGENSYTALARGLTHVATLRGLDGTAWCWGLGTSGQLGDSSITSKSSPVSVAGGNSFIQIACGTNHTVAIRGSDGTAWAWGVNTAGELGDNTKTSKSSPVSVVGGNSYIAIAGGASCTLAIRGDNTLWAWGDNGWNGKCGQVPTAYTFPQRVITDKTFTKLAGAAFGSHILAIQAADGAAYAWGFGTSGQLGDNTRTTKSTPVSVLGGHSFIQIGGGSAFSAALRGSDGTAWAWGSNSYGQLGDDSVVSKSTAVSVLGGNSFIQIAVPTGGVLAVRGSDGTGWGWGFNSSGQLGDNTTTSRSSPVSIVGDISFKEIASAGAHCVGIRSSDGTAWAWGRNDYGQLGDNTLTDRSSPVSVRGGISFKAVRAGQSHTTGIRGSDGSAWAWGNSSYAQLCTGTYNPGTSSPISCVGGNSYVDIQSANFHLIGLLADGTVRCWGYNYSGQCGIGEGFLYGSYNTPISPMGNHSFVSIAAGGAGTTLAFKANGEVWAWGDGFTGQWGNNNMGAVGYSSPVSVPGGKSFISVIISAGTTPCAIEKDTGIIFHWGENVSLRGLDYWRSPVALTPGFQRRYN